MRLDLWRLPSPIGTVLAVSDGLQLRALDFEDYTPRMYRLLRLHYGACEPNERSGPGPFGAALWAYFDGDVSALDGIAVATGGTPFQREVWAALRHIPVGQTTTYGRLAASLGRPLASRAVGLANGSNPVAIVVPCHRVIGQNGSLTGFGGGLERKQWLLDHERRAAPMPDLFRAAPPPI